MNEAVRYELTGGIARIALVEAGGTVLNRASLVSLSTFLERAARDSRCRAVVLEAEPGEEFCRGLDLDWLLTAEADAPEQFHDCLTSLGTCSKPVIARIAGRVVGGGLGLVAACDIVIAASEASFQLSEVIVGMIPALIAPFLLTRLSPARLRALALGSRTLTAPEAWQWGLVDEVAQDDLDTACYRQIDRLLRSSPDALAATKRYLQKLRAPAAAELALARTELAAWLADPEHLEGIRAFAEGFAPPWFARRRRSRV
ncbi:enoyl-CoA hydratase/isomerase family protein [Gloeobacter kilaueensis]|uniref:Enoyl-CoA hydratase/isomerase n=1 Tax=Gloeobacter kilaueensis (strain ATCC BAA-2537 / CCAP 1431/1 / ULC 316 / JS1) TaxID=1183438 RepID=U5QGH8_GLOK1|nr:enoyl-CoA hydratase-related protein [Gloeobacter kilaueensis]AGY58072.1 enoyl-CoA hydratase/isomerase [Gloeobacter kilaueensis JS1]